MDLCVIRRSSAQLRSKVPTPTRACSTCGSQKGQRRLRMKSNAKQSLHPFNSTVTPKTRQWSDQSTMMFLCSGRLEHRTSPRRRRNGFDVAASPFWTTHPFSSFPLRRSYGFSAPWLLHARKTDVRRKYKAGSAVVRRRRVANGLVGMVSCQAIAAGAIAVEPSSCGSPPAYTAHSFPSVSAAIPSCPFFFRRTPLRCPILCRTWTSTS